MYKSSSTGEIIQNRNKKNIKGPKVFLNGVLIQNSFQKRGKEKENFKENKTSNIKNLMNIKDEERFKIKELIPKINNNKQINKSYSQPNIFMNKEDWFNGEKTIFMEDMKYPKKSLFHDKEKID